MHVCACVTVDMDLFQNLPSNAEDWIKEYAQGCGHEIYRTRLSPAFKEWTFNQVVNMVYQR